MLFARCSGLWSLKRVLLCAVCSVVLPWDLLALVLGNCVTVRTVYGIQYVVQVCCVRVHRCCCVLLRRRRRKRCRLRVLNGALRWLLVGRAASEFRFTVGRLALVLVLMWAEADGYDRLYYNTIDNYINYSLKYEQRILV